jgi:hypothetical protein
VIGLGRLTQTQLASAIGREHSLQNASAVQPRTDQQATFYQDAIGGQVALGNATGTCRDRSARRAVTFAESAA